MASLHDRLAAQLGHPRGAFGRLLVRFLNRRNRADNADAVAALGVRPGDRALDLGFGGGVGLSLLLDSAAGSVSGADLSADAVAAARRRFGECVRVVEAAVPTLPFADGAFDRILTINTVYFWSDGPACVRELHRVLAPGGRLVVGVGRPEDMRGRLFEHFYVYEENELVALLRDGGFSGVHIEATRRALLAVGDR